MTITFPDDALAAGDLGEKEIKQESKYEVILFWDKVDGVFFAEIPELPGCMAHGQTRTEALSNAEEAISLWIETAQQDGIEVPEPRGRLLYA